MSPFVFPQIWDLADPEGKGYLDKQVHTCTHRVSGGAGPEPPGQVTSALPPWLSPLTSVTRHKWGRQTITVARVHFKIKAS